MPSGGCFGFGDHDRARLTRRQVLGSLVLAVAAGCVARPTQLASPKGGGAPTPLGDGGTTDTSSTDPSPPLRKPIDETIVAGPPELIFSGSAASGMFALTIDDGTCADCAAAIVTAVEDTGFHLTLSPNGNMGDLTWNGLADRIAELAANGQVSLCNHTWDHADLTRLRPDQIRQELNRNEDWIQERFGVTSRPFYRPPFGFHDQRVDDVAGQLGWTKVIMWNKTLGDSALETTDDILAAAQASLLPGTILLSHANHPPTSWVINQIFDMVQTSGLRPATLLELLGTAPGPRRKDLPNYRHGPPITQPSPFGATATTTRPTRSARTSSVRVRSTG